MKVQVECGFVKVNDNFYFSPKLCRLEGAYVDVSVWCDEEVDVYVDGKFYCEAAYYVGRSAMSPMKPAEKGRIERALYGARRSARYPMMGEFPAIPDNCRCRSGVHSNRALRREVRRTARSNHRLSRSETQCELLEKILSVMLKVHDEQMEMLNKLEKSIQELRG